MSGFEYLVTHAHSLQQYRGDLDAMMRHLPVASGGEQRMIRAAISLLHPSERPEEAEDLSFDLREVDLFDSQNFLSLLRAIAQEGGHPELIR